MTVPNLGTAPAESFFQSRYCRITLSWQREYGSPTRARSWIGLGLRHLNSDRMNAHDHRGVRGYGGRQRCGTELVTSQRGVVRDYLGIGEGSNRRHMIDDLKVRLLGTWRLVSAVREEVATGRKYDQFGAGATGTIQLIWYEV